MFGGLFPSLSVSLLFATTLVCLSREVMWKESGKEISNGKTKEDILRLSFKRQLNRQTKVVAKSNDTEREGKRPTKHS